MKKNLFPKMRKGIQGLMLFFLFGPLGVMASVNQNVILREVVKKNVQQQDLVERVITGVVSDANTGETIIGANVVIKGTALGTATDVNGHYSLKVRSSQDILVVSFVGYKTQEIEVGDLGVINVKLLSEDEKLNEVVVVGAGVQKKVSVTGAISTLKGDDLRVPSTSLTSALAGRLAGVVSSTSSGEPGTVSDFYIRGIGTFGGRATPLIILDGVEISTADLNYLPAESIESFSILKDASATAIYGARGANGVMIVTTKSGMVNEKTKINVTLENSFNVAMRFPEFVDGATWMEMYNEAQTTRDHSLSPKYDATTIKNTRNGVNPLIYPDVDWKSVMFNNMALSQRANVNVQGGGNKATYYMSLQFNHDGGLLNTDKLYSWNNNINILSYTFQNNINYNVTKTTKLGLRMNAQLRSWKGPNKSSSELFGNTVLANPVAFPVTFPAQEGDRHVRFGNAIRSQEYVYVNPYAEMVTTYKQSFENTINVSLTLDQDLDFITKGLKINGLVNFKNWSENHFSRTIAPYYYRVVGGSYDEETGAYELENIGPDGADYISESEISKSGDRTYMLQFRLDYARTIDKHNVSGMLLYQQREYQTDVLPNRNQTFSGRATYDYDHRYLLEFNFGYNGTERLAKHDRFEFFPAVSLGWVISNEQFFQKYTNIFSNLKLRGSYGLVGSDETGLLAGAHHFLYIDDITLNNISFTTGVDMNTTYSGPIVNNYGVQNAGWERVKKLNIGLDLELFGKLSITADYFKDKRYNILLHREAWPESLGYYTAKPWSNVGKVDNWGFDMSMNFTQNLTENLMLEMRGTVTYNQNKYVNLDEPVYPHSWQTSTGKPLSYTLGYIADGLFASQEEINNHAEQQLGSTPMVGDIKYRDINGDGVINSYDQVMISKYGTQPRIQYGFGATVLYKKFDFGVFFTGSGMRRIMMPQADNGSTTRSVHPFGQDDRNILQFIADSYWTESNPDPDAAYPRLGLQSSDIANNTQNSTYWMRNGSFLRFKNFEVGYKIPFGRVYVSGNNLATFSKFKEWDPETAWNAYPMQRTFNVGLQLNF